MSKIFEAILTFLRKIRFHWAIVYAGFAIVAYLRIFKLYGTIVYFALLLIFYKIIKNWDIQIPTPPVAK